MKIRISFLLAALLSAGSVAPATDYYLDAVRGDDSNAGTSADSAWKTLLRVNRAVLRPGDRVCFKTGQVWRGTLNLKSGDTDKPVVYTSFGGDAKGTALKPRIIRSIDLTNPAAWLPAGRNIWRTVPDKIQVGDKGVVFAPWDWRLYCEGEGNARLETGKTEDGRTLFKLTCLKAGKKGNQIQFTNSPFAVRVGQACVYRFRARASLPFRATEISLMKTGAPWTGYGSAAGQIYFKKEWQDLELLCQPNTDAEDGRLTFFLGEDMPQDCVLEFVPLGAFEAKIDTLGLEADVGNIILSQKGRTEKSAAFKRWNVESLKAQGDFFSSPFDSAGGPRVIYFYSSRNPAETYGCMEAALKVNTALMNGQKWFVVDGLAFGYTAAHGISGAGVQNAVIRNCDFFWIGGGHLYTRHSVPTRYGNGIEFWCAAMNNLVENCRFWQIYDTAMTNQGPDKCPVRNMTWRGNTIYLCEQAYEIWLSNPESEIEKLVYEKNRSFDCGFGWGHVQRPNKNGTHLLAYALASAKVDICYRENVFCNAANTLIWYYNPRLHEVNCSNNIYWQDGAEPEKQKLFMWAGQNPPGVPFDEYRQKTGNDANSRFEKTERIKYFDY